jgi:hypothetical protein
MIGPIVVALRVLRDIGQALAGHALVRGVIPMFSNPITQAIRTGWVRHKSLAFPGFYCYYSTVTSHEEATRLEDRVIMWYERGQRGNRGCNDDQIRDCKKTTPYFGMA